MKGIGKLLLDKGIIEEDDIQIYLYGIKGGITIIVNILTTLLIGLFTGKMLEVIIFSLFLASLRSYSGGYHCSTKVGCFWLSSIVTAISAFSEELVTLLPIAVSYLKGKIMEEVQTIVALGAGFITKRVFGDGRIERCDNVKDVALYIEKIDEMIERKKKCLFRLPTE